MQSKSRPPDQVRREKIHQTFDILAREIESLWMEMGNLTVPNIDPRTTARRIVSLIQADSEIAMEKSERSVEHAKRNLAAVFLEEATEGRNSSDDAMSPNDAAAYLRMSRGTLNKLLDNGELRLRTWKVGSHTRISRQDVEAYWDKLMHKGDAAKEELVRLGEEAGMYEQPEKTK